jgi:hypothetical protein
MRAKDKLTARAVAALVKAGKAGKHSDGSGLYLRIDSGGVRSQLFS